MTFVGIFWKAQKNFYLIKKLTSNFSIKSSWIQPNLDIWLLEENYVTSYTSQRRDGALLVGSLYKKNNFLKVSPAYFKENYKSIIDQLVDKYWGEYVFFHYNKLDNNFSCTVSPTGEKNFFYKILEDGSIIFSSDIFYLLHVNNEKIKYNESYLLTCLLRGGTLTDSTAFSSIHELPAGCRMLLRRGGTMKVSLAWNPSKNIHVPSSPHILESLLGVTGGVLNDEKEIMLDFSGGLDSSILLYTLHNLYEKENIKAINVYNSDINSSNEFIYARKIAEKLQIELLTIDTKNFLPMSPYKKLLKLPNHPSTNFTQFNLEQEICLKGNADRSKFVNGHGGDHLFSCPPLKELLCDIIIKGQKLEFFNQIKELMIYYRKPMLYFLNCFMKNIFRYIFSYGYNYKSIPEHDFPFWLKQENKDLELKTNFHPFYSCSESYKVLPGQFYHIDAIYRVLGSVKGHFRHCQKRMFFPYLTQPIIEIALSIQTYDLFSKGINRYPLRQQASQRFQSQDFWRKDKGETSGVFQLGLKENLKDALELLTEGFFVKQKLVDKEKMLQNLQEVSNGHLKNHRSFMRLLGIELFLRDWRNAIQ